MILTLKELAEHLKVNERTILRMKDNGQIEGTKIGGQWRFNGSQIDKIFFPSSVSSEESPMVNEITRAQTGFPVSRTMNVNRMFMNLKSTDPESVIEELTSPHIFNELVLDVRDLQEKCQAREHLCSTAVGKGIAVPHPRDPISTLQIPGCIVYGYSKKGIEFGAADNKPVHMFFLLCSQNIDLHLHLMSALANLLKDDSFIKTCMKSTAPEEIYKAVMEHERASFLNKVPAEDYE
ncbi:MAG: PTS sugar transporter subunit IIA [Victivallales bacterium]|nr:PTS sugar transporter subunit IIA [Victivallales bacterium]